ncbi:uncharacterized protein LOC114456323 [Gouania willdenowi]|uniref:uncharacterized protein LOC114456323 n=1 Tax=Gouania willdenowi TaxID=441366 RepID=UPI0010553C45|nr:uncharacterized protein LOC114456323 [Gouania willdenowi]
MVEYLGMPSEDQLLFGMHTKRFFCQEADEFGLGWRLLTPEEYSEINRVKAKEWPPWRPHFFSLDDLLYIYEEEDAEEFKDRTEFIDFLKHLLTLDEEKRFSPTEALQHPFIRMSHLSQDPDSSDYLTTAQALMPTEASHSVTPVKDGEAHVAEEADEVPPTPASSQITHIETDVPKVPLSHVNDDNERVQEPCQDLGKELHLPATQSDSGICSFPEQFPNHCDEGLECVSSVNGPMVEDVPFPTPKRFKNIRSHHRPVTTLPQQVQGPIYALMALVLVDLSKDLCFQGNRQEYLTNWLPTIGTRNLPISHPSLLNQSTPLSEKCQREPGQLATLIVVWVPFLKPECQHITEHPVSLLKG